MLDTFHEIWCVDFEFQALAGELPKPICAVALEIKSGKRIELFGDDLLRTEACPYSISSNGVLVAYMASAELGCHLALNWQLPENVLDLYAEFRCMTNGLKLPMGSGLLGALHHFDLNSMAVVEKDAMRSLALRGGPWTESEKEDLLDYCGKDTEALVSLLDRMAPLLHLPLSLLRGRYMKAVARMEYTGIPVDAALFEQLKTNWASIRHRFIEDIDAAFGVYQGCRFSAKRFREWLDRECIDWPEHAPGHLKLCKKTFKQMAARYPQVEPLRQLRQMLSQLRTLNLPVGEDGYSRTMLSPYRSKTGRNQPSTTNFIFGLSKWSRKLTRPLPGRTLAYVDWKQQEFGIAAALSEDMAMMEAYRTGDPYLAFAKQAGAAPPEATKDTHVAVREQYKQCSLAVLYGMGAESLAERLGISVTNSRKLLATHHETYRKFWQWSDATLDYANLYGELHSTFGWSMRVTSETREPTLRNFLMQANGAEMLRLACCLLTEQGIRVCAPVHDAVLVESPITEIDNVVQETRRVMAEASAVVLGEFTLSTDETIITESEPLQNVQGEKIWEQLIKHLEPTSALETIDGLSRVIEVPRRCTDSCSRRERG